MTRASWGDYALLGLLALLWGSSYLWTKVAVAEIPPVTLIALRVTGAAALLLAVLAAAGGRLPSDPGTWGRLFVQSVLNSTGAWTILAWGQQHVPAGLASVLNSTSPVFVLLATLALSGRGAVGPRRAAGATLGLVGVVLIVGPGVLAGLGAEVAGQAACLLGAVLYAGAALHGPRLSHLSPLAAAAGTMLCASAALVPAALVLDAPWTLEPSPRALAAAAALALLSTGVALLIYFRLVRTLGPLGVASQSYLRAGVGVALGVALLAERPSALDLAGLAAAILGVALINWPASTPRKAAAKA
jgi:drug/metabolite transporter (DMT)-like permease